jgi:hypothetical protein
MKHVEIFKEIELKVNQFCDEALKEGGIAMFSAVHQLSLAITQIMSFKKPEEKPPEKPPGE